MLNTKCFVAHSPLRQRVSKRKKKNPPNLNQQSVQSGGGPYALQGSNLAPTSEQEQASPLWSQYYYNKGCLYDRIKLRRPFLPTVWQSGGCLKSSLTWSQVRKMAPCLSLRESHPHHIQINKSLNPTSVLVYELVCISVHPVLWRECHFIKVAAVIAAFT